MNSHHIYNFGQSCLTLLASCMKVTYYNYNTNGMNEALINNLFAITLQTIMLGLCATTQLLGKIIIFIIIIH
jgi:hypothetical protein